MEYSSQLLLYPQLLKELNDSIPPEVLAVSLVVCPTYNLLTWWKFTVRGVNYKSPAAVEEALVLIEQHAESRDDLYFRYEYTL